MILDAIVLDNFGIYGGRQEIILTPEREGRPIVLFGGLNGGGKTTFLDAVQLAFYGTKARCSNRGKLAYHDYLRAAIHRDADPGEGASLAIHFRRAVDGETHSYRLLRAWREGVRGIEETVEVLCDGEPDSTLSQHWDEYIESYIPSGIAHLFFFDAEQIKDLAEGEQAAELLGTAIHSLLGLDLVDQLETDLVVLERRKKATGKTGEQARRLQHAEEELARLERMQEEATTEQAKLNGVLTDLTREVEECEKRFQREGGELFERRTELEDELAVLKDGLADEENLMRQAASGAAPLLLIAPMLGELEIQLRREAKVRRAQVLVTALEDRDAKVLKQLRKARSPASEIERLDTILREDRDERRGLSTESCYLHADENLPSELRHLCETVLRDEKEKISAQIEATSRLRNGLLKTEVTLARVPDEDVIARLQRDRETLRIRHQQKKAEVDALDAKFQLIVRQRVAAQEAVKRALEEDTELKFGREDRDRILKHSAKVRGTLAKFRTAIIRKHALRIERLMLEAFTQLLRKTSLVTALKIDPETFRIELTGGEGRPLPFERLSSGERQLLATSLLWGLARASGRPLPTIIDTPLGRLDSSHRRHLVERYFPVASHQVILLSTDEEIDEDSLKRLRPHIGRTYHLQFDEALRSTRVTPGYFWNHEAAC
ncbi:MAG: DNA sulfur modification protein DndD [Chthoniobacteraceae bacterium]